MKKWDLTVNGGGSLTQNRLAFLQQAWTEAIQGIVAQGGAGPFVLSGAVITRVLSLGTVYNYSITDGWVWYEGNLLRVAAMGPVAIDESINKAMLVLTAVNTTIPYNDGSNPAVMDDTVVSIVGWPIATADDAGKFAYASLVPFGRDGAWTHVAVATGAGAGTCIGDIYYKRNWINNTVAIRGEVTITTPTDCPAFPARLVVDVAFLPYAPSANGGVVFSTTPLEALSNSLLKDHAGGYHDQLSGGVSTGGNVYVNFILPDAAITVYGVFFDKIFSLD